ncbi:IclR family transcriptional regulator [Variovorax sp. Sphag1AA]|uniref:IclR family transcriptional regulator n=1 Tax=Variovorax sp. Sphag1AA TaxID=2587027 RepID=UPI00161EEFAB|nr:IclR family transcriptional regulator [Variovorax sp. Sphag1AA]MBB3176713.1 DNA-binding IclR family transcriptional regulator [Variovorax sp. Sphag1AA]
MDYPDPVASDDADLATTPGLRLLQLLELVAAGGEPQSLSDVVRLSGQPKPSVHRMLQQLEHGGLLSRGSDGRRYAITPRLMRFAETVLRGSTVTGVRHAVLRQLVADVGETCNLTALSGAEVIYLDRVETAFPLRLELRPGSRVPLHCSASGKLFLAYLPRAQRDRLLAGLNYERHTSHTLQSRDALEAELDRIRQSGHSVDAEEFIDGLVCVAVPVRDDPQGPVRCAVALQAPAVRMALPQALQQIEKLRTAAQAIARAMH